MKRKPKKIISRTRKEQKVELAIWLQLIADALMPHERHER